MELTVIEKTLNTRKISSILAYPNQNVRYVFLTRDLAQHVAHPLVVGELIGSILKLRVITTMSGVRHK